MFVEIKRKNVVIKDMGNSTDFRMCQEVFQEVDFWKAEQGSVSEENDTSGSVKNDWYKFAKRLILLFVV